MPVRTKSKTAASASKAAARKSDAGPGRRVGVYPGTFDPITNGHMDVIQRACKIVDHLIVGVAKNIGKGPLFSTEERVALVQEEVAEISGKYGATIEVQPFDTLLMNFAVSVGASVIIRGLRAVSDFEYEFQMTGMNHRLNPDVETVFLMASDRHQFISSRFVKEIGQLGGDIRHFVTPNVAERLASRFAPQPNADAAASKKPRGKARSPAVRR